ncbi:MAG: hypothetical protein WC099_01495 [Candidatus Paceibacterota bacterium]
MAIVIQEDRKKSGGWFGFGLLFLILIIVGLTAYYLFFVQPDLIDTTIRPSSQLQAIDDLKTLQFNSTKTLEQFTAGKKQFIPIPSTPNTQGNAIPFGVQ